MPEAANACNTVVCDLGSAWIKSGFAGSDAPTASLPSLVGWQASGQTPLVGSKTLLLGDSCAKSLLDLKAARPVQKGCVQDWEAVGDLWQHTFRDLLKVDPHQQKMLVTESPLTPPGHRHRLFEILFERFGFAAATTQIQAALTLYAQGLMTGLSVDAGDVTHVAPVVDGYAFPHLTRRLEVAGEQVTSYLLDLLLHRGYTFNRATDLPSLRSVKESICYVAAQYQREVQLARETTCVMRTYTLPDGRLIRVGAERFKAPECMFTPRLIDCESEGLSEMIFSCIQGMDVDNRMAMYQHIVLSGGSTMFGGVPQRIENDIRALYLQHTLKGDTKGLRRLKLRIDDPPHRHNLVYLGASILAGLMGDDSAFWIRRAEWEEDPHRAMKKSMGAQNL
ncbi:hypothetical protein WJX73_010176 [Symbiochloris irregularis]|uniref:Actin-related protein 2 n=1 Tax=Symbiochloris irregularis TaxID=706552 RepID=A0AAW1PBI9_9CHLO